MTFNDRVLSTKSWGKLRSWWRQPNSGGAQGADWERWSMCVSDEDGTWRWKTLRAMNLSRSAIDLAVEGGFLLRLRRGVYASSGCCEDVRVAATHGGALACVSAAAHLGLWTLNDGRVHVWIRGGGHAHKHADCVCVDHWDGSGMARFLEAPSLVRVLAQILQCQGAESFFVALESARRKRLLPPKLLRALRLSLDAEGRDLLDFSRADSDSGLESLVRLRLRKWQLDVRTQVSFAGIGRVDLLINDRLIVEVDGELGHADVWASRSKDLRRDAMAAVWGYRTLRFDYALVLSDWDLVEQAILASIA